MITPHKKNVLTHAENYKLVRWIEDKKDTLNNLSQEQIARLAKSELGYEVTIANIYGACNVLGIKLGFREIKGQILKDSSSIQTVAKHLVYLYTKLGEPVPPNLQEIAKL